MDRLTRDWLILIVLTFGTVIIGGFGGPWVAALLLALSWGKARTILGGYLHLGAAPGWLSLVMVPLAIWMAVIWALHVLMLR